MKNKQSDEVLEETEVAEAAEKTINECIKLEGERTPVDNDRKSVKDDFGDYVFAPAKRRVRKKRSEHKEDFSEQNHEPIPFYKSDRSNDRSHHHHHHGHRSHRPRKKRNKMERWKKIIIVILCVLLAIILLLFGTLAVLLYKGSQQLTNQEYNILSPEIQGVEVQDDGDYVIYKGKKYELNKNITNILFMGVDKRDMEETDVYGTGGQADFIALGAVDTSTGEISFININRDTKTDIALYSEGGSYIGTEEGQLCLSYAYGDGKEISCQNTVSSVQRIFYNIPINTYFSLDLEGIVALNDTIGGVDVVSPETIYDFVEGETYHLEGEITEDFVRKRDKQAIDANVKRNERQKVYLEAFMDKCIELTKEDITTPISLYNVSKPYSCTNLNPSKICYLAESMVSSNGLSVDMMSVPGDVRAGKKFAEFYVDEEEFYDMFLDVFYNEMT